MNIRTTREGRRSRSSSFFVAVAAGPRPTAIIFRLGVVPLLYLPVLTAIWGVPWFVSQDGPSHLYNAHVLTELIRDPNSPFHRIYELSWRLLPNLSGHVLLMALLQAVSPRTADRTLMTLSFAGLAAGILWLRWRVAGASGFAIAELLALLLSLNFLWIMGFYNFLIGAALFPVILGVWWSSRNNRSVARLVGISALLLAGYCCHIVSVGLTVGALGVLAALTPGPDRARRATWTAAAAVPLLPFLVFYRGIMSGGPVQPIWLFLRRRPWDLRAWASLADADPFRLNSLFTLPFVESRSRWFALLGPTVWIAAAVLLLLGGTLWGKGVRGVLVAENRGWLALGILLLIGWAVAPDAVEGNGQYLRERVLLIGLMSLVPALDLQATKRYARIAALALAVAAIIQVAFVWDYALTSNRLAGSFLEARKAGLHAVRFQTLLVEPVNRFSANPLTHIDGILGVKTGNSLLGNYEAENYNFNVRYRSEIAAWARDLRKVHNFLPEDSAEARSEQVTRWDRTVGQHPNGIDALVVWGFDSGLDAAIAKRFGTPMFERGMVRVFRRN